MKTAANDAGTYLTWMDSLRPETAAVTVIDETSPLWAVYEGARNDLPIATAVPTSTPEPSGRPEEGAPSSVGPAQADGTEGTLTNTGVPVIASSDEEAEKEEKSSTGLDLLMGCIFSFVAITHVFLIEMIGWLLYHISAGFYKMADAMHPPNVLTGLFYSIFFLVYSILALVDSILLLVSVLVAELLAAVSFVISCLFGGCHVALRWHQYIRKTCHRTRWAFRCRLAYENPPRQFCTFGNKDEEEVEFEAPADVPVDSRRRLKEGSTTSAVTAVSDPFDKEESESGGKRWERCQGIPVSELA